MSWYHLSYDATGTVANPNASNEARIALLTVLNDSFSVAPNRLYRPTESSIIFYTEQPYLSVHNAIRLWSQAVTTVYVLSVIAMDTQGRNFCVWNPNVGLSKSIQVEYGQLVSRPEKPMGYSSNGKTK